MALLTNLPSITVHVIPLDEVSADTMIWVAANVPVVLALPLTEIR